MTADEFIKGFSELRLKQPRISLMGYQNQNCPYANNIYNSKECYLCFNVDGAENSLYSGMITRCKMCVDCEDIWDSELCYEGVEIYHSYNCDFSQYLRDCYDCSHCYDCLNCHNCFGCVGLRRANYYIFNERVPETEYFNRVKELKQQPQSEIANKVENLRLGYAHVGARQYRTENCFGDNIENSKNCFYCFNIKGMHDAGYLYDTYNVYGERSEDLYDAYFSVDLRRCYECVQVGDGYNCNFCHCCEHLKDSEFCDLCFNSHNLFGCISVNRKEYLILNQQFKKEEWHKKTAELRDSLKKANLYSWPM